MLVTELAHPQHRATFTAIYNSLWYVGAIVAAWLTFGTLKIQNEWSWRIPSLVQAFPSILQLIFVWVIDESPRFLVARGKSEQALRVLAKCHANGNDQDEVVQLEMQEIHDTLKMEQEFHNQGWAQLFQTKGNRHRMAICMSLLFPSSSGLC
jgi:MFS family permease